MQRIFVTGMGVATCVGNQVDEFWANLLAGRCGLRQLQKTDPTGLPITVGGEVRGLRESFRSPHPSISVRRLDEASLFAIHACGQALDDAELPREMLGDRCGVVLGSGLSGLLTLQEQTERLLAKGPRAVSPYTIPMLMPNAPVGNVCLAFGITGPGYTVSSACSSSGHAIIDAVNLLRRGEADAVVTGGTEASLTRLGIACFANMKAMSKSANDDPQGAIRPFDKNRDGFIMSEGAAALVLETEALANKRGATPLAEVVGYGMSTDAYHLVKPDPEAKGATAAVRRALESAAWDPAQIAEHTYVNAHGTATVFNDRGETLALQNVFGSAAEKLQLSSTKSVTGHMIGAACAVETVAGVLALRDQTLPPTINYKTPDPLCPLDCVPNEARRTTVRYVLNNSFGFGGHNVCLALASV